MWGFFEKKPVFDPSVQTFMETGEDFQSNIKGIYLAGDIAGYALLKSAVNQADALVESIAADIAKTKHGAGYDLLIAGAGAAGLSAAMAARRLGLKYIVLEAGQTANTIRNFPLGKHLFAEPKDEPVTGGLWLGECAREEIIEKWESQIAESQLNIKINSKVADMKRIQNPGSTESGPGGWLIETTTAGGSKYVSARAILAIGKQGNPRKLNAPGEDLDKVRPRLDDPAKYKGKKILVIGGGDAAAESSLALCGENEVSQAMIEPGLIRPKAANVELLQRNISEGKLTVFFETSVKEVRKGSVVLNTKQGEKEIPNDEVIVNIGAEPPWPLLRKIGVRAARENTPRRIALLSLFFTALTSMFIFKSYWNGSLINAAANAPLPLKFVVGHWYGIIYTALVLGFGAHILLRPRQRHFRLRRYVRLRTTSLMFFQTVFLFLLPMIPAKYIGSKVTSLITVWPLTLMPAGFANSAFVLRNASPEIVFYAVFTAFLAFVAMPVFVYFHGKRYCSWICGCAALAETFGEPFRDLAPKGLLTRKRERVIYIFLAASVIISVIILLRGKTFTPEQVSLAVKYYGTPVYLFFSAILGVGLYAILGARVWCRYFCPLAAYMNLLGAVFSRYKISSNDRCIDCGRCNRYCEMGIDVKAFALQRKSFSVRDTPCVGCGECIAVCPMDVLKFGDQK